MKLSEIKVNRAILMDIITDDSVYAIVEDRFCRRVSYKDYYNGRIINGTKKWILMPIGEITIKELLSEETIIVQITE